LDDNQIATPLLATRILLLLRDARRSRGQDGFVAMDQLVNYFGAMKLEASVVLQSTGELLERGMCWSYDPTVTEVTSARRVELSPSGFQHLLWATRDSGYVQAMLEVTPIVDEGAYRDLDALYSQSARTTWQDRIRRFAEYLVAEDIRHCMVPDHVAYDSQRRLRADLESIAGPPASGEDDALATLGPRR
jgi:hypothetical protein